MKDVSDGDSSRGKVNMPTTSLGRNRDTNQRSRKRQNSTSGMVYKRGLNGRLRKERALSLPYVPDAAAHFKKLENANGIDRFSSTESVQFRGQIHHAIEREDTDLSVITEPDDSDDGPMPKRKEVQCLGKDTVYDNIANRYLIYPLHLY